ncbi:MAG: hypothetical protein HYZ75_06345 [Elusimicrobia bacterium]|nr:hypothetical protein [Elusimicrobiota bacterium]
MDSPDMDGAEFVKAGSLRVDRARALEKLKERQLADPETFLLPWARCAAASGAESLRIDADAEGVTARFDGRPFSAAELEDPYACLLDDGGPDGERGRNLAAGLLAALRLKPVAVEVSSGEGAGRVRLRAASLEGERLEPAAEPWPGTLLRVRLAAGGASAGPRALEKVRAACGMFRIPLFVSGEEVPSLARGPLKAAALRYDEGSLRGCLVRSDPDAARVLHLYQRGVKVEEVRHKLPLPMAAHLDDEAFTLNASLSGVVRNERFDDAMSALETRASEFLIAAAAAQAAAAKGAPDGARTAFSAGGLGAWLRRVAAARLGVFEEDSRRPALKALWEAPLYLDTDDRPLSLRDIDLQARRVGMVLIYDPAPPFRLPWSKSIDPSIRMIKWLDGSDRCLRALFPERLKEYS